MRVLQKSSTGQKLDSLLCYKEDYSYSLFVTKISYTSTSARHRS